jgi:FAD:protein FMN transferase
MVHRSGTPATHHVDGLTSTWMAWGTEAHVAVDDPAMLAPATSLTVAVLGEVDRACSRFRPESDLVRANRLPGQWVDVDPVLATALSVAVLAAELTDGLVTPCLGRVLAAVDPGPGGTGEGARSSLPTPDAWRELGVGPRAVRVPFGCELDLGATANAWAADVAVATVVERLGCRVLVGLGGDIRVGGPPGPPWAVEARTQPGRATGVHVALSSGALASSATDADDEVPRLLDPRTNRPVIGPVRAVTVTADSCLSANIASTAALLLGEGALPWLESRELGARLVREDGAVATTSTWPGDA